MVFKRNARNRAERNYRQPGTHIHRETMGTRLRSVNVVVIRVLLLLTFGAQEQKWLVCITGNKLQRLSHVRQL